MLFDLTPSPPRTVDGYLELIARVVMASGMSWQSIEPRWPSIREAFDRFSVRKVAAYAPVDIDRALAAPGMIRNTNKVKAVAEAAQLLAQIRDEFGSVTRWLSQMADFDEQQLELRRFPFVGPFGAYCVLSVAGFGVPRYDEWRARYVTAA